ncbi:peptidyl-tRNA hydrolase [Clostridia bacterium]|nr:peptidyl-tRNA hydrolase [Clostridia bacterium]
MILIAGLGNPEKEYGTTRHNAGFMAINQLSHTHGIDITKTKFRAELGSGKIADEKVVLLKPQTYMNLSGESIRECMEYYKLSPSELIVLFDDCDLDIGAVRVRKTGSGGGHNGMKNIIYQLETMDFTRVRIGIGKKPPRYVLADYVLGRFAEEEREGIIQGIETAASAVSDIIARGADYAMNHYNKTNSR